MFFSLKDLFEQYKTIIKNSFFLSIVYGIRLLLPFIAMPYIIRVCGAENYGKIILAQTVACYFSAFVNWGLPTILPKEIADNVHSVKKLSAITTAATLLKLLFALAGI
ncbi:MAG: oligosaccharide flippase family protein, partial [Lentisphaeria bacterium]|nr:oligosaccharide flippase family protein [Lentisphaeria bacterium]